MAEPQRRSKDALRREVWARLREARAGCLPFPLEGRIPNFVGAEAAAERLFASDAWRDARTIKANPDSPQLPVRRRALAEGKVVLMAVPRLRDRRCFVRLDPARIAPGDHARAATIGGMARFGEALHPRDLPPIDLVVAGAVAVRRDGERIGKSGGYADPECAILRQLGRLQPDTPIVTAVHDLQVVDAHWRPEPHAITLDAIFTPTATLHCRERRPRPAGVLWEALDADRRAAIPVLGDLA